MIDMVLGKSNITARKGPLYMPSSPSELGEVEAAEIWFVKGRAKDFGVDRSIFGDQLGIPDLRSSFSHNEDHNPFKTQGM